MVFYHGFSLDPCLNSPSKVILSMILDNWGLQDKKILSSPKLYFGPNFVSLQYKSKIEYPPRQINEYIYICIQVLFSSVYLPEDRVTKERSQDYSGRSCAGKHNCCGFMCATAMAYSDDRLPQLSS